ncbi:hypothetical protein B0H13DRAFT_2348168 [Mycena leptocephala]|nr:hypothetical protein B0H13DRAFT_2348168 [Mycena leptocephala]
MAFREVDIDFVRLEHKDMLKTLEEMQRTMTHLELGSAAPLRMPSRAPEHKFAAAYGPSTAPIYRSCSPVTETPPSKRTRLQGKEGVLTMGTLPTFDLDTVSHVMLDPVYPYHLRVILNPADEGQYSDRDVGNRLSYDKNVRGPRH